MRSEELPVVVIGAGPVGLAAAAHLYERGMSALVLESGSDVAANVRDWAHVRLFSPWRYNTDAAACRLLRADGWTPPNPAGYPTGGELIEYYLRPLAAVPPLAGVVRTGHRVVGVARAGLDKVKSIGRDRRPFVVAVDTAEGHQRMLARAVLDASGTWATPGPIGAEGLVAPGEAENAARISYGIPDVLGAQRLRYAGRSVAVVGSGHSAQNVVRDLAELQSRASGPQVDWLVRRDEIGDMFGRGGTDELPARGELGAAALQLVTDGAVRLLAGFRIGAVDGSGDGLTLEAQDGRRVGPVDEVIAVTGSRPDLTLLRELRLSLDPVVESTDKLAPLIDPNVHSCGSVRSHGAAELAHPEPGVYLVGMKSYGRAPTFLLSTGYEQVRSVVAELDGDHEAAAAIHLELPNTGACAPDLGTGDIASCCRPDRVDASTLVQPATTDCRGPTPQREPPESPASTSRSCGG